MYNVLVQKKQAKPIKLKGAKPKDMMQDAWSNMDELARSTIMLSMSKSVYYNIKDTMTSLTYGRNCATYMNRIVQRRKFIG